MARKTESQARTRPKRARPTPVPPSKRLPPLPRYVCSPLGPVPVLIVPDLKSEGDDGLTLGVFRFIEREIRLRAGMPRQVLWATLFHECMHLILWDAGVQLPEHVEEQVCDAYASARVAEMLAPR